MRSKDEQEHCKMVSVNFVPTPQLGREAAAWCGLPRQILSWCVWVGPPKQEKS